MTPLPGTRTPASSNPRITGWQGVLPHPMMTIPLGSESRTKVTGCFRTELHTKVKSSLDVGSLAPCSGVM